MKKNKTEQDRILEYLKKGLELEEAHNLVYDEAYMRTKFKWDVKRTESVTHFDPTLSYEHTGYIPLTMTSGLDFNVLPFTKSGRTKEDTGKYTMHPIGSKGWRDFWIEEMRRCKEGYRVGKYRISGDYYFFLNFYTLMNVSKATAGKGRTESRPSFWAKHYEYFHYVELAEMFGYDIVALKARGVGWSEVAAAMGVSKYVTTKKYKTMYVAFDEKYLTGDGVFNKVKTNIDWINENTEEGFLRSRAVNQELRVRSGIKKKDGTEVGHLSECIGLVVDKPRKLRGARLDRLFNSIGKRG